MPVKNTSYIVAIFIRIYGNTLSFQGRTVSCLRMTHHLTSLAGCRPVTASAVSSFSPSGCSVRYRCRCDGLCELTRTTDHYRILGGRYLGKGRARMGQNGVSELLDKINNLKKSTIFLQLLKHRDWGGSVFAIEILSH